MVGCVGDGRLIPCPTEMRVGDGAPHLLARVEGNYFLCERRVTCTSVITHLDKIAEVFRSVNSLARRRGMWVGTRRVSTWVEKSMSRT